jgi:hypothetical protein
MQRMQRLCDMRMRGVHVQNSASVMKDMAAAARTCELIVGEVQRLQA